MRMRRVLPLEKYDSIVYFSSIPWEYSFHRQQDMMSHFAAKGYRVLYVEPPLVRGLALLQGCSMRQARENVTVLRYGGLRFERCLYCVEKINQLLSRFAATRAMKRMGLARPLIWFDRIHGVDCSWFMSRYPSAYDLVDEITAFGRWNNKRLLEKKEREVMRRTDFRITSSRTLAARKQRYCVGKDIFFCPNGVDCSRFCQLNLGNEDSIKQHPLISGIGSPVIGFVGTISRRGINTRLLKEIASANPAMQFVLIGPNDDRTHIHELSQYANIHCFDRIDSSQIPDIIAGFDVGIIPYNTITPDMDYVFPRKAFEYLASGVPVVTTPLPELVLMDAWLYVASGAVEFSNAIHEALRNLNNPETKSKLRTAAQQYDWNVLLNHLEAYLQFN